jgi:hypothetical protein
MKEIINGRKNTHNAFILYYVNQSIILLITEMGVSNEAKSVIPLKLLRKIKNNFFPIVGKLNPGTYCIGAFGYYLGDASTNLIDLNS